ncbi:DUF6493 family protein [Embleya sp. AB8]|uniref:DUF6493 family protein n=1 Tax=Embleya sp. AB8 TaxID=3156304 RepID=UPI003C735085
MTEWALLRELIDAGDAARVEAALRGLDAAERKALAGPLVAYERAERANGVRPRMTALAVAGAALLPGATPLAAWLGRNRMGSTWTPNVYTDDYAVALVMAALRDRAPNWLPTLMARLAERLPTRRPGAHDRYLLVEALAVATGTPPPLSNGYVLAWLRAPQPGGTSPAGLRLRRNHEQGAALLLRLFEVDGVGAVFGRWSSWPDTFPLLIAEGQVDRADVLTACVGRLGRPGRPGELTGYLRVFTALEPTPDETALHARELVVMLTMAPGPVAGVALTALIRADRAGRLPFPVVLDAAGAVFTRTEKKLVRGALTWLDTVIARDPAACAPAVLPILALAFGQQAADLQRRAVSSALHWLGYADHRSRAQLATAARDLPADQRSRLGGNAGVGVPSPEPPPPPEFTPFTPLTPFASFAPEPMPPPIVDVAELAAEIALLRRRFAAELDPVAVERILAALVTFGTADRTELRSALAPIFARDPFLPTEFPAWHPGDDPYRQFDYYHNELMLVVAAASAPARGALGASYPGADPTPGDHHWRALVKRPKSAPLHEIYPRRLRAIAIGLAYAPGPELLSEPTHTNGLIDPSVLVARLARAAAQGRDPWPFDLEHALRRLPIPPEPELAEQAASLGTPSAIRAAHRLATGHTPAADPGRLVRRTTDRGRHGYRLRQPVTATLAIVPTGSRLGLTTPEQWLPDGYRGHPTTYWAPCLPSFLPADRDLIAAHLVPQFAHRTLAGRGDGRLLPMLAGADGPIGAGLTLALAHGLNARDHTDRTHAADALSILAARDQLDGTLLGDTLGHLAAQDELTLTRIVQHLRDLADAGAAPQIWSLLRAALPHTLAAPQPPTRHADLLELAVHVAGKTNAKDHIPGLQEAATPGSSRSKTEARRLLAALTTGD